MWNCELKTRPSDIVSHLRNNYRQILTQQLQKGFLQCHFKMFSKPLSPFEEFKTNKSVFIVSRRFFLVLNWTTNSRRGIKNLFRSRQRENKKILWTRPRKWQAKVQPNKTEKRQRRKCQGRFANAITVHPLWNGFLECALRMKTNNNIAVFFLFFLIFIQLCDSRKIHYLTREFHVKLHLKTDIALIASRFVRYRFSRAN